MYRPLSLVTFAIEHQLSGGNPQVHHLVNVLIFCLCIITLFKLLSDIFGPEKTPEIFIACLLFAVHPIHTEVVANIKSRDELLCFILSIAAMRLYMKYLNTGMITNLAIASIFLFFALLSKETAIIFILLGPLVFLLYSYANKNKTFLACIAVTITCISFLALRLAILKAYNTHHTSDINFIDNFLVNVPFSQGIATIIHILGKYLQLLVIPHPLISDYSYNTIPLFSFSNTGVILSVAVYIFLIVYGIYRLYKFPKDIIAFGIIFYIVSILLFSNLFFFIGAPMADRFLFFPSLGFCLVMAELLTRFTNKKNATYGLLSKTTWAILLPVAIIYSTLTYARNEDWENNLALFSADILKAPDNARLNYFLGNEFVQSSQNSQNYEELLNGIAYLHKSTSIYQEYAAAYMTLGNAYFIMNNLDSAEYYYNTALKKDSTNLDILKNLDVVYFNQGKYQASINICKKIINIFPDSRNQYRNIGVCYIKLQQYDSAITALHIGIQKFPNYAPLYQTIAAAYGLNSNNDSAKYYEQIALKYDSTQ